MTDAIRRTLAALERRDPAARADLLRALAETAAGHWKPANPADPWDSQRVELRLHEVFAEGADAAEATRNWIHAARRMAERARTRDARVEAASALIAHPGPVEIGALLAACETVLHQPSLADPDTVTRARALRDHLGAHAA